MKTAVPVHVFHTESIYSRGGEKYLYEMLRRVAKTHRVRLYLHAASPKWIIQYKRAGIDVQTIWRPRRLYWFLIPVTIIIDYLWLRPRIDPDDVVIATNFPMNILAVSLSRHTICHCAEPLPIFYDPVRIASLPLFSQWCVRAAKHAYAWLDSYAYQRCATLTTLNTSVERHVMRVHGRKPDVFLPNGVNDAFFSPPARVSGRTLFTIGHSTDYTVFKGTQDFLAILARLKELRVPFRAVISESIADPITKRAYEDFIKTHNLSRDVTFVGTLSETGLVSFYRHLDVFVFTGSPEGSGAALASLSVLEAAACGVPVVRSIGDDGEVREGVTGYYINPHKALKAAKTIAKLLHMAPNERQRMRRAARAHVVRAYGWDASATLLQKEIARLSSLTKKRRFQE